MLKHIAGQSAAANAMQEKLHELQMQEQALLGRYSRLHPAVVATYKEMQMLDDMYTRGDSPWELWKLPPQAAPTTGLPIESPPTTTFQP
jgi:hypothetical protein